MMDQFKFTILTTNIRFHSEKDGDHSWPNRKNHLSELISQYNPLVFGTQEGRRPQLIELGKLIPKWTILDQNRNWITERMYPCLFYRADLLEVISSGDIWLSQTPAIPGSKSFNSAFPRLCTWGQFKEKKNGHKFLFVNCHLDHLEELTRIEQIKVLLSQVQSLPNLKYHHIILMGDFNDSPDSDVRKKIEKSEFSLRDPWIDFGFNEESSHHKFNGHNPDGKRIDWILISQKLKCHNIKMIKDHRDGIYPSDHFPIFTDLELA